MTLHDFEARFACASAEPAPYQDQQLGMLACREALVAALSGNYGVGAVLVDPQGTVVAQGQNAVFYPHFRSDLHAEMVVMNAFEEQQPAVDTMSATLLSSTEPCPMCFARPLAAGVQTVSRAWEVWSTIDSICSVSRQLLPDFAKNSSRRPSSRRGNRGGRQAHLLHTKHLHRTSTLASGVR